MMMTKQSCLICGTGADQLEEGTLQDIFQTPVDQDNVGVAVEWNLKQKLEFVLETELRPETCHAPNLCSVCEDELDQICRYCTMITKFRKNYMKTRQEFISAGNGTQSPQITAGIQDETDPGGPSTCPKCGQVYSGPSSLKRHLWRIHRMCSDKDADKPKPQDQQTSDSNDSSKEDKDPTESSEVIDLTSPQTTADARSLSAVSLTSSGGARVRPLLSLSPEPAGFQQASYGAGAGPMKPLLPGSGASAGQGGLLPTPSGPAGMPPAGFHPENPLYPPHPPIPPEPATSLESKVQPLMSVGVAGDFPPQGIQPLMSLPVPGVSPFPFPGGMPCGFGGILGESPSRHNIRARRKDRRAKPFQQNKDAATTQDPAAPSQSDMMDDSSTDNLDELLGPGDQDEGVDITDEVHTCSQCDAHFVDSMELADHELDHGHSVDISCDTAPSP